MTFSKLQYELLKKHNPQIEKLGFRKALQKYVREYNGIDAWEEDLSGVLNFVPDGYYFDGMYVHLFEIEDTHPIPYEKFKHLVYLWMLFDAMDIELTLTVITRYGVQTPVDLCGSYFHLIKNKEI